MKPQEIWQAALGSLQLQMTRATFDTWVKDTRVISYEDGTFVIGVENAYAVDWLENRLLTTIKRTLVGLIGHSVEVHFVYWPRERPEENASPLLHSQEAPAAEESPAMNRRTSGRQSVDGGPNQLTCSWASGRQSVDGSLNSGYTFDRFIVGNSNRLAHAASLAVAERPAEAYNPLFLYGGVGLGKTHLLQAIAHCALARKLRVIYISSETFTNDLIKAIRNQTTEDFRGRYRKADFLLVDDIQFIAGKESTQEEFFHTFNSLHSSGRQIAISCDRPPKAIVTLEERLRSRFEWGLIADIQPPDLETRIAILRSKAEERAIHVPAEVVDFIGRRIQSNIRELEGALNSVIAHASLVQAPLTIELAQTALHNLEAKHESISMDQIIGAVARFFDVDEADLRGPVRSRSIALPRQIAMYLAREELSAPLSHIGEALGGRDHTTVLHGWGKISSQIEEEDDLRRQVLAIREILYHDNNKLSCRDSEQSSG
jgi:chromosomal replication initiator protein